MMPKTSVLVPALEEKVRDKTAGHLQDLFMEVIHDLEKHLWMFRSQIQAG